MEQNNSRVGAGSLMNGMESASPADHVFAPGEPVLDRRGRAVPGYCLDGAAAYRRARIHAAPWRLKEWDFYQIADERLCLQLVIGHVSYAGNCNVALFDHREGRRIFERGVITPLPLWSMRMPERARADSLLTFRRSGADLSFETKNGIRRLKASFGEFSCSVELTPVFSESVAVCTPFHKPNEFYYNEKVNLLKARVSARVGETDYVFDPDCTFSLLDWGRGVWPFHHEWYWSSASTLLRGTPFGFNLGCGFGDEARARGTENMVYYNNHIVKLGRMRFSMNACDPMRPWKIEAEDGRFSAVLTPRYDRDSITKLLFIDNRCHQMFGTFAGEFTDVSGERVPFDVVTGFAEHAVNRW